MRKPRIFIGSSVESLPVAEAMHVNLDHDMEVTLWRTGTFSLSNQTVDDLFTKAYWVDFGLFVFTPDDLAVIRDSQKHVARDNVVFELGLFIGALGKRRCFVLKPRDTELHLPSDLAGLTTADYNPERSDGDMGSALVSASVLVKKESEKLGIDEKEAPSLTAKSRRPDDSIELNFRDENVLKYLLKTETTGAGVTARAISEALNKKSTVGSIDLSIVKLCRMGLTKKMITEDDVGNAYVEFFISDDGIEYILSQEDNEPPF